MKTKKRHSCYNHVNYMRKYSAVSLVVLVVIIGAIFVSPVGNFLAGVLPLLRPAPPLLAGTPLPFSLPEGFAAYLYAADVPDARVIIRDPKNTLLVSEPKEGKVVALPNTDTDLPAEASAQAGGKADRAVALLEGLNNPHGLLMRCSETGFESVDQDDCMLYVAESHRVGAYRYDADTYTAIFERTVTTLPDDGGHHSRTLMAHPDNKRVLVSVGSSCNVCVEEDERRAAILAFEPDRNGATLFATGLRNTVFMTTHYVTGDIWGTDMGRDNLGDDLPPDELNIIREGGWYGWPWFYGKNIEDMKFSPNARPSFAKEPVPSHIDIPAHSAPLGLAFIPEEGWPEEWWYDLLVAYHGSWNRSMPTGYKIVRFPLDAHGNPEGPPADFMTGFMGEGSTLIGRPVDLLVEPGGVMYISDDRAGAIYRIARTGEN